MPAAFTCRNVPRVHKPVDLVHIVVSLLLIVFSYSGHNTIWSFIDIFVEILDCHDHRADFNIDVGVILGGQVRVIRNDPAVINVHSVFLAPEVRNPILCITGSHHVCFASFRRIALEIV